MIEKPADPMAKMPKGVFKNTFHNPNAMASTNYSVMEDLDQNPYAMSTLEVLQSCPSHFDALLAAIGSMESTSFMAKF